jgi:hypothetical protein
VYELRARGVEHPPTEEQPTLLPALAMQEDCCPSFPWLFFEYVLLLVGRGLREMALKRSLPMGNGLRKPPEKCLW